MSQTIATYRLWIEQEIDHQLRQGKPKSLYDPIRHIMSMGSKRIRPLIMLVTYSFYQRSVKPMVPFAIALEALHNFTLLHDDIMDQSHFRRGKPTVHRQWDVNTALLSGNILFSKVYEWISFVNPSIQPQVFSLFNDCIAKICEGQRLDMDFENASRMPSADEYMAMATYKTAVFFGLSFSMGALLAYASRAEQKKWHAIGLDIGLAFQLQDDMLDVYGEETVIGKQVGNDIEVNKKTLLLIKAFERSQGQDRKELLKWIGNKRFDREEKIRAVRALYDRLSVDVYVKQQIDFFFYRGIKTLATMPGSHAKQEMLKKIIVTLMRRRR